MSPDVVTHLYASLLSGGLMVGAVIALVNAWRA